jgi:hypothetical protein
LVSKKLDDEMAPSLFESYLGFEKTNLLPENPIIDAYYPKNFQKNQVFQTDIVKVLM